MTENRFKLTASPSIMQFLKNFYHSREVGEIQSLGQGAKLQLIETLKCDGQINVKP